MYKDMTGIFYSCDNCKYDGMQHFDEPCEDCTTSHCAYEEYDDKDFDEDREVAPQGHKMGWRLSLD